jgi:hypothetical protein
MKTQAILAALALILPLAAPTTATPQQPTESKAKVSDKPLAPDQLSIYKAILQDWPYGEKQQSKSTVHLSIQTTPEEADDDCAKGLEPPTNEVHRFRAEDLSQLGPRKLALVDPEAQQKEVAENDPGKHIRNGTSIADAVANGFAHGLVTLGEIRFDPPHTHALVHYDFSCGNLCGNGATVIFEKTKTGAWKLKSLCSTSIA